MEEEIWSGRTLRHSSEATSARGAGILPKQLLLCSHRSTLIQTTPIAFSGQLRKPYARTKGGTEKGRESDWWGG